MSPFSDNLSGGSVLEIENITRGTKLSTADLTLEMIRRYGFYEGKGTPYRLKPEDIIAVFPELAPTSRYRK